MKIGKYKINLHSKPFIIAEMSANHDRSLKRAMQIVELAAKSGAQAIKLQTYKPSTMTLNIKSKAFMINNKKSPWHGKTLYQLYKEAHTPWEWHKPIFKFASKLGLIYFSTPFDNTAVDFLETLNVPAYKVASFEITDLPLIKKISSTGKPLIISTGMANFQEIKEAVSIARKNGSGPIALLKCTSSYPAEAKNSNLMTIPFLRKKFNCEVGLSDHTISNTSAISSVAYGATIIEKHLTINRKKKGIDNFFSSDPSNFQSLVKNVNEAFKAKGKIFFGPTKDEKKLIKYRRTLYAIQNLKKNEKISKTNILALRGGKGMEPKYLFKILGKKVKRKIKKGTPIKIKDIKK